MSTRLSILSTWRALAGAAFALAGVVLLTPHVGAQVKPFAVVAPGEAVVTGFSGAPEPITLKPGEDPRARTFIDLAGPSIRVIDIRRLRGPPEAQFVTTLKPFAFTARDVGQAFGVVLDDSAPPNIYVAATSAYGLPIVAPGADGALAHVRTGAPGARFMPGLWGPHGGPGSIYRIDGVTAKVTLFADVRSAGRPNSGAALGALAYDARSKSLYAADRESGLVHRFSLTGADLGVYDHGTTGLAAQGLPPVPAAAQPAIDIAQPSFDSAAPQTWGYALPERRVFGLAVHDGRLYYAVADSLRVWSVGLRADGGFDNDAVIELQVPPAAGPTEMATVAFDHQGRMLLAERPAPTGDFAFEPAAHPGIGRVLRYAIVGVTEDGRRIWQPSPDEFATGFPADERNANGGVAEGPNYSPHGDALAGSCGGFLWSTGENLRDAADATLAARLARDGPIHLDGLQGEGVWQDRPRNHPPLQSYYVGYGDGPWDTARHGLLGAIVIPLDCAPARGAELGFPTGLPATPPPGARSPRLRPPSGATPPGPTPPVSTPPSQCPPNQVRRVGVGKPSCQPICQRPDVQIGALCCPPSALAANGACSNASCTPGSTPVGPSNACCPSGQVYTGANGAPACCSGQVVKGQCSPTPPACAPGSPGCTTGGCAPGYVMAGGACCLASQATSTGICCPSGQTPSGPNLSQCGPRIPITFPPICCNPGLIPSGSGKCCAPGNVTSAGECCARPVDPANRSVCPAPKPLPLRSRPTPVCAVGYAAVANGTCCLQRFVSGDGKTCLGVPPPVCPAGTVRRGSDCVAPLTRRCPDGQALSRSGVCVEVPEGPQPCPDGQTRNRNGACVFPMPTPCPQGETRNRSGACVAPPRAPVCPEGTVRNGLGTCAPPPSGCPPGFFRGPLGFCRPLRDLGCPPGTVRYPSGACVPAVPFNPGFGPPDGGFGPSGGGFGPRPGPFFPGGGGLRLH